MSSPAVIDWSAIRRLYLESDHPVSRIAEQHQISPRRIYARARAEGWPRRSGDGVGKKKQRPAPAGDAGSEAGASDAAAAAKPTATAAAKPNPKPRRQRSRTTDTLAVRRTLVRRLYRAIDTKLQQMEARMAQDMASGGINVEATAADHERDTRAIGTLIANLSRITEIEADLERTQNPALSDGERRLADEAERFRREVAERLARLVRPSSG